MYPEPEARVEDRKSNRLAYALILILMLVIALAITWGQSPTSLDTSSPAALTLTVPLRWPVTAPSSSQIQDARQCDVENLAPERYPMSLAIADLADAYQARTACDWAVLAFAYAARGDQAGPPEEGETAFVRSVSLNAAYALKSVLLFSFFTYGDFIEAPPLTAEPLVQADLQYNWRGQGDDIAYVVTISGANSDPVATGTVNGEPFEAQPPADMMQRLGQALTDLVPIGTPIELTPCSDNFPDWRVRLTYADGSELEVVTHGSNVIALGGPWQVVIEGQSYMQHSLGFFIAIGDLIQFMELPWGQPVGSSCAPLETSLLDVTYP